MYPVTYINKFLLSQTRAKKTAVINISSSHAFGAWAEFSCYCSSKCYSMSLSLALTEERTKSKFDVMCLTPAGTATQMTNLPHIPLVVLHPD